MDTSSGGLTCEISSQSHNKGAVFRAYSDNHLTGCRRLTTDPERNQQSRGSTSMTCTISPTKPPLSRHMYPSTIDMRYHMFLKIGGATVVIYVPRDSQ